MITTRSFGGAQPPVIVSSNSGATVYGAAGASFTDVTQVAAAGTSASVSNKLFYTHAGQLSVMDFDGKNKKIINLNVLAENPTVSPDGKKVAFESNGDTYLANIDGTNVTLYLSGAKQLAWSPDGTKICFIRRAASGYDEFFVANSDGSGALQLSPSGGTATGGGWSADSKRLVYGKNDYIYSISPDGSGRTQLVSGGPYGKLPTWSPDGTRIAFLDGGNLWEMRFDGSQKNRLRGNGDLSPCRPSYSADSKSLFFTVMQNGQNDVFGTGTSSGNLTAESSSLDDSGTGAARITVTASPTVTKKLIGTGGSFGTSCAGFLFSQIDRSVSAVASFDTKVSTVAGRATARVAPLTASETGARNLVFSITSTDDANLLGSFKFANGTDSVTTVVPSTGLASASGIIVSFSASDGGVATILPFTANKSAGTPATPLVRHEGSDVLISANFVGMWNGKGRNVAPGGLREVRISTITGLPKG